jgi:hypothetical protein
MKHKLPIFAIMVVSSQLTLAEAANDPVFSADTTRGADVIATSTQDMLDAGWDEASVHPDIADVGDDVSDDLAQKLDASLKFEMVPRDSSDPEFAGSD